MFTVLQGTVTDSVVIMLNVSLNTEISDIELLQIFQTGKVPKKWAQHISRFYNELYIDVIKAFVAENAVSEDFFLSVYSQLPTYCGNPNFTSLLNAVYQ